MAVSFAEMVPILIVVGVTLFGVFTIIHLAVGLSAGDAVDIKATAQYNRHARNQIEINCRALNGDEMSVHDVDIGAIGTANGLLPLDDMIASGAITKENFEDFGIPKSCKDDLEFFSKATNDNKNKAAKANTKIGKTAHTRKNYFQTRYEDGDQNNEISAKCLKELDEMPRCPDAMRCVVDHAGVIADGQKGRAHCLMPL